MKATSEIFVYAGRIQEWSPVSQGYPLREETRCGRLLLLYALWKMGCREFFQGEGEPESLLSCLEEKLEKGVHGKPFFPDMPDLHFNISHGGGWAVCALASVACGIDIQDVRPMKSKRLLERTMDPEEQRQIRAASCPEREFARLWAYKESCLKLTGEGITRSMRELPPPVWHRFFRLEDLEGCAAAGQPCLLKIQRCRPEDWPLSHKERLHSRIEKKVQV